ncbi:MAG: hypothetical protein JXR84_03230 [Anaerolineae bacterium]|nr:hypothetical protein [Anaerolineae bacterium]
MEPQVETGIARAMAGLGRQAAQHPEQHASAYLCYWAAFTNIYAALAAQQGVRPHFGLHKNGTLRTRRVGTLKMAEIDPPAERELLDKACVGLDTALKHKLITHTSTRFFVQRTPVWRGKSIAVDRARQRLNGVLDMRCTFDARYPLWRPIDAALYARYIRSKDTGPVDEEAQNVLARQILDVLQTVAHNLLYSSAPTRDENAPAVIEHALALLAGFVEGWLAQT